MQNQRWTVIRWAVMAAITFLMVATAPALGQSTFQSQRALIPSLEAPTQARGNFIDSLTVAGTAQRHDITLTITGLEGGTYDLEIGGQEFTFTVGASPTTVFTRTNILFNTTDVRVIVSQNDVVLLSTMAVGPFDTDSDGASTLDKSKGKLKMAGAPKTKPKAKGTFFTYGPLQPGKKYPNADMYIQFKKLEPDDDFILRGNGWPIASFSTNSAGGAAVIFTTSPLQGDFILNFDPVGVTFDVVAESAPTTVIMSGVMTAKAPPNGGLEPIDGLKFLMATTGVDNDAVGRLFLTGAVAGAIDEFTISVTSLGQGNYDVMIDDTVIGTLTTGSDGSGSATFAENPGPGEQELNVPIEGNMLRVVNSTDKVVLGQVIPEL